MGTEMNIFRAKKGKKKTAITNFSSVNVISADTTDTVAPGSFSIFEVDYIFIKWFLS